MMHPVFATKCMFDENYMCSGRGQDAKAKNVEGFERLVGIDPIVLSHFTSASSKPNDSMNIDLMHHIFTFLPKMILLHYS